jgi:hypothetical protein
MKTRPKAPNELVPLFWTAYILFLAVIAAGALLSVCLR